MRQTSGCLQPTQLSWLPVLSNVDLLLYIIRRQLTMCFKLSKPIQTGLLCWCLWASTSTACISMPNMVRHDICRHNYAVEKGLVVGFCGQPHCYRPYYPTARFRSPSSYMVSDEPFPDRSRRPMSSCRANLQKWSLAQSPSCDCGQRQTINHIDDKCLLTKSEGGLNLLHEADDDAALAKNNNK